MSVWNDEDTKALAATFGADNLLDKMRLADDLVPAVMKIAQQIQDRTRAVRAGSW